MNGVITYHSAINVGIGFSIVCVICGLEHSWIKSKPHFDVENAFYLKVHLSYFVLMAIKYFELYFKNGNVWHNDFICKNISKWTFTCSLYTCKIARFLYVGSKLNYKNQQKVSAPNLCQLFAKLHVNPQTPDPLLRYLHVHGIIFQLHVPGIAIDMRTANLMGISGVVFTWQYSSVMWFRLVTTTHSSFPVFS